MSLFNAFYGTYGYLPIVGCLSFDQEPEQYLVAALLRDGKAPAKADLLLVLKRLLPLRCGGERGKRSSRGRKWSGCGCSCC